MIRKLLAFSLLLCSLGLNAQLNPKDIYVNGKENTAVSFDIISLGVGNPSVVVFPENYDTLSFDPLGAGVYEFTFVPETGYMGDAHLTIEYFEPSGIPGFYIPNYTTLHYRVESSKMDCDADYELMDDSSTVEFDVLNNDATTDGQITLGRIALVEGGSASIVNDKIAFTADGSMDYGYVRYFTADDTDNIESASLYITFEDDQLTDARDVYVNKLGQIDLYLNSLNYSVSIAPNNGTVSQDGHVWTYDPYNGFTGTEQIVFTSPAGGTVTYNIQVLNKTDNRSFVRDDQFFLVTDGTIDFNVFDNDYRSDFNIIDYSSELTYNGNGSFSYSAPSGFTGDQVFYYKIFANYQFHTGNIVVHVDDFAPSDDYSYDFTILNNHDLVINHEAPITEYFFTDIINPSNGSITILDANGIEILECETITGENTIIYSPNTDFSGGDAFTVEYCTTSGICENIEIHVDVLSSNYEDCLCLTDCVYEGDINQDGVVNHKDVLALAVNLGEGGAERTNDFDLFWTGQYSDNWGYEQENTDLDLNATDTDGNGYIDIEDFSAIENNYTGLHNFVPNEVGTLSTVPISFVPQSTEVDSGEWLFIDIYAGTVSNPALDFYGLGFTFNIDADIMDSSSVTFTLANDNWLSYNAPLYELTEVPFDGQIDIAVSRINNISTDGIGIIGTLGFIVEDEVDGFKESGLADFITSTMKMHDIVSVNALGEFRRHPDQEVDFKIRINDNKEANTIDLAKHVRLYPNPTRNIVNIESDRYTIERIQLFDAMGRLAIDQRNDSFRAQLDLSALNQGVYFARIISDDASHTIKVQKID